MTVSKFSSKTAKNLHAPGAYEAVACTPPVPRHIQRMSHLVASQEDPFDDIPLDEPKRDSDEWDCLSLPVASIHSADQLSHRARHTARIGPGGRARTSTSGKLSYSSGELSKALRKEGGADSERARNIMEAVGDDVQTSVVRKVGWIPWKLRGKMPGMVRIRGRKKSRLSEHQYRMVYDEDVEGRSTWRLRKGGGKGRCQERRSMRTCLAQGQWLLRVRRSLDARSRRANKRKDEIWVRFEGVIEQCRIERSS